MSPIIKIKNITKHYGKLKALNEVSLNIEKGKICSLLGENGAGKSTLIKLILGISQLGENDTGTIQFKNKNKDDFNGEIGYVPEEKVLIDDLSGEEYVDFMARLYKCKFTPELIERKEYFFNLFNLTDRKKHLIRYYSNGMKKKILIISALIHNPKILIVDEPFAALDPESIYILKKVFLELIKKGCTVIISSHNLDIVEDITNRLIILNKGNTLYEGTPNHLFEMCQTNSIEESYLYLIKGTKEMGRIDGYITSIPYTS